MQAIRTLFWVLTSIIIVVFAMMNWDDVSVLVWPNLELQTKKPVLILGSYVLGMLPIWLVHRASKWNLTRRLENAERQLADQRAASAQIHGTQFTGNPLPNTVTTTETPL